MLEFKIRRQVRKVNNGIEPRPELIFLSIEGDLKITARHGEDILSFDFDYEELATLHAFMVSVLNDKEECK